MVPTADILERGGDPQSTIERNGFAIVDDAIDVGAIHRLLEAIAAFTRDASGEKRGVYGVRNLLQQIPAVRELIDFSRIRAIVDTVLSPRSFPVRAILFDKTPQANWKVAWHQDLSIAVQEKHETAGYGPWSVKDGVVHVQPPLEILQRMLTIRIHLDDCDQTNGALQVAPGSHRLGIVQPDRYSDVRGRCGTKTCEVKRGGALVMRPLLLHASSMASRPVHRRVVHLEFADTELNEGLRWAQTM